MTLCVYEHKSGLLLADTRGYKGGGMTLGKKQKLHYVEHCVLTDGPAWFASSNSRVGMDYAIWQWFANGMEVGSSLYESILMNEPALILVGEDGSVRLANRGLFFSGPIKPSKDAPCISIGSMEDYFMGAYMATGDLVKSVQQTVNYDDLSDFPVCAVHAKTGDYFTLGKTGGFKQCKNWPV